MTIKYWAGVGSRETPVDILKVMIRLGRTLTDMGYVLTSGDAFGADRAFYFGAAQSGRFKEVGAKIYVINNGFRGRHTDNDVFIDVSQFKDMKETYEKMAEEARGGFYGLNEFGKALHSRNVLQVHGPDLDQTISGMFLYSKSIGKKKISGGTNTAYQLALKANVPIIKNLYVEEDLKWCHDWLDKNESKEPYDDVNWKAILEIKDNYTPDKDGIDHVNIYSKSKSRLGHLLSNFANTPFVHKEFGWFRSMECFYAWLATGRSLDVLRGAKPVDARKAIKESNRDFEALQPLLKEALTYKFEQTPEISELFRKSKVLPFTHYYWYGDVNPKIYYNKGSTWLEDTWEEIRNKYLLLLTLANAAP